MSTSTYIPISLFCAVRKCCVKPLWIRVEDRFWGVKNLRAAISDGKKIWSSGFSCCIFALPSQAAPQLDGWKNNAFLNYSAFFDILLPQKVRQEGLSETHAHGEVSTMLPWPGIWAEYAAIAEKNTARKFGWTSSVRHSALWMVKCPSGKRRIYLGSTK